MTIGIVQHWQILDHELIFQTDEGTIGLSFTSDDIFRLRFNRGKTLLSEETFVIQNLPPAMDFNLIQSSHSLTIITATLRVDLSLDPLSIRIYQDSGKLILSTPTPGMAEFKGDESIVRFILEAEEKIYGLGQDPMARLNHRDQERRMWHEWGGFRRSGNAGIPFLISNRGFAILLNSSWASRFAVGRAQVAEPGPESSRNWAPPPWSWAASSGETHPDRLAILLDQGIMDLWIICRDSIDDLLAGYADLTGHAPLPPKWALGFIQCKNRYRTQAELLSIAREYRRRQIPCDTLVIDWLWFKEFGDLEWFKPDWPDPQGMLKELADLGFHVVQAQHPFIDINSLKYETFRSKGYLNQTPQDSRPTFDHSNPQARDAWWNEIKRLYQDGIRGYWTDMGELEVHPVGTQSHLGPRERVHNIYSTLWTQGLYENQRQDFKERVFSLPRTAYAGIQRNGAAMWSGDISATWDVLRDQVVIGQGVCLSGQQYWTTDIGGFFTDDHFTPELYIRWFQWGAFCPIFRTHGTRPDNEAWSFGSEAEKIITDFIKLRYRLMPYIYSCARLVTEKGTPIMRAMCIDFPDDPVAVEQEHQFMFGPALLVAPVLEAGSRSRRVYLPTGLWYDFWTDKRYPGKQWIEVPAPLSHIPLFIRAGSLIPMGSELQYIGEKPLDRIEIHAYPGIPGSFELYEDDGLTYAYEQGAFAKIFLHMDSNGQVFIDPPAGKTDFIPTNRGYNIITHGEKKSLKQDASTISIDVDTDQTGDGRVTIHALINSMTEKEGILKASLELPAGWKLKGSHKTQEIEIRGRVHLQWEAVPYAITLPLVHTGQVKVEINYGSDVEKLTRLINWGSGFATQWAVIGHFDNADCQGLERVTPVEDDPDLSEYLIGDRRYQWSRDYAQEFNCFGYVDLRTTTLPELQNGRGVAYARCRIWSDADVDGYMEISADPCFKLWLNKELTFRSQACVLKQVISEPVRLRQGWNKILVKIAISSEKPYSGREYGFNFRLVDANGQLLDKLLYSV